MVDIFSKSDGPRREDVAAKRVIEENKSTIHLLADQISGGGFSRSRTAMARTKEDPKPEGLSIHILGCKASGHREPAPEVRASLNGRVIVVDTNSGKQLQFLGQMRRNNNQKYFALSTKDNGFVSPVDEKTEHLLADLNGIVIESDEIEEKFVEVVRKRLCL